MNSTIWYGEENLAYTRTLRVKIEKQLATSEHALQVATERYNALETAVTQENHQLRRDKHELEGMLRRKDDELQQENQIILKETQTRAVSQLKIVTDQLERLKTEVKRSEQIQNGLKVELDALKADKRQRSVEFESLRLEFSHLTRQLSEQACDLAKAQEAVKEKDGALQLVESHLSTSANEVERQKTQLLHQENQLQLLETKLNRSIPVDDEELQRKRQMEESNWNQRLAALEYALAAEKQTTTLLNEQHRTSIAIEREKAAHAIAQAKAVAEELEVANMCLAERKKQRKQEKQAFKDEKQELHDRVTSLVTEIEHLRVLQQQAATSQESGVRVTLENKIARLTEQLRVVKHESEEIREEERKHAAALAEQLAQLKVEASWKAEMEQEINKHKSAANAAEAAELEVRRALEAMAEERDLLVHKVQTMERATPRNTATLWETRVELQKARQKIVALEEQTARSDSSRLKDQEGRLAQLSTRERKSTEEQK
uniref:Uncharacterized protein n=1 Tax=Globisporangium ultimum (strain ATCC 200006 / CBS 805.95 / DAOM BR144) TaxID=431595 RepID=K3WYW7_GLOUD